MPALCRTRYCARDHYRHTGLTPPIFRQGLRFQPHPPLQIRRAPGFSRSSDPDWRGSSPSVVWALATTRSHPVDDRWRKLAQARQEGARRGGEPRAGIVMARRFCRWAPRPSTSIGLPWVTSGPLVARSRSGRRIPPFTAGRRDEQWRQPSQMQMNSVLLKSISNLFRKVADRRC
jgi:hypothetical protein